MRFSEGSEFLEKSFVRTSFEGVEFHGLSQIIASFTRESVEEWEAITGKFFWTQTGKDNTFAK